MTYIKYGKKKFYKNSYALDTRKTYNKAEPNGLGFIKSYRKARAKHAQNALAREQQRRAAAKNAVRRSIRLRGSSPTKKRKRTNNMDPAMIISG